MKPLKTSVCTFCGRIYIAKDRRWKPTCSVECGQSRLKTATRNLKAKSGEYYERWRHNLYKYTRINEQIKARQQLIEIIDEQKHKRYNKRML